ncbi:MAG TPA: TerB family tellurite resistance protein [Thiotrichaceae bacterium]|jgi:uncharacterized tellurite resistance protein B-like protein|nr:TerB family tellurite resistance protein [Thiotrichaceae bacterium]HIM08613.1 TerB family tellurite resistance protein [Gammaproteobacteria bacterium]
MINNIKSYFEELFQKETEDKSSHKNTIELATAVLMIEISLADDHIHDEERREINNVLHKNFNLQQDEIDELIALAEEEVDHSISLYEFIRLLNDSLTMQEKINILENLWRVAYADSVIDKYEEYYIRKVADLLYIAHSDYIRSKLKAAE